MLLAGCVHSPSAGNQYAASLPAEAFQALPNPLLVPVADQEFAWNQIIDGIDDFNFKIRREHRVRLVGNVLQEGRVETFPSVGSTLLEPWHKDSSPGFEKLHATLQSIRRRCTARVVPAEGGYSIEIVVIKELEDLLQPEHSIIHNSHTRFDTSPERTDEAKDLDRLPPGTLGWIPLGRDIALEQRILENIRGRLANPGPTQPQLNNPAAGPVFP